jgi:hypothetical protein
MSEHTTETVERGGFDRREALKKAAVAGGIVWAAPMIMSSPAQAQQPPCTPKCAPETTAFSFAGTTVRKLGCVDPNAPAGQEQYIVQASMVVTATTTCPCTQTAPGFTGDFVFEFTSPAPGRQAFAGTGGEITVTCTDIDGSVIARTCQFTVAVVVAGNCMPQTGIQRFVEAALTGCGTPVCVTP